MSPPDRSLNDPLTIQHLALVVESSDDAIVSKDLNGIIKSWNKAAERMFGYTAEEAIGRSIRMIIPDNLQDEEDMVLARIRRGDKVDHYETTRQRKDGTPVRISLTISPLRDENGRIFGASKIARDVTERARLQRLTEEHAQNSERLAEVGAIVASTLERDTVVQQVTDAAVHLTGAEFGVFFYSERERQSAESAMLYTLSGVSRAAFASFPQPRIGDLSDSALRRSIALRSDDLSADPKFGPGAPRFEMAEGRPPVRSYLAVPVRGMKAEIIGGLFFGHSQPGMFTAQHERLARGVAAWASVALENARLYSEAQHASRLRDEFLAVLSHELRTPLNAIVGYARLLRGGVLSGEKAQRGLDTLERNATALTQIVEDVLDVSRIISGKMRLDVQSVDLATVVDNAIATVQPAADAKGVRLVRVIDPRSGPVSGDPERLQQVIWNLLANAVKFTPRGGRVQTRVARVDSHIEIVVSDSGIGIRPEFLPHVFERFRQADGGLTRKSGGLGLGLAIARHIVEMHGGTISAESGGEGQGSTFGVQLPLMVVRPRTSERDFELSPAAAAHDPLTVLGDLRGIRVLAVDNEEDALTLLRVVLEAAGAQVTTASSGEQALALLEANPPDVMVADLGMPGMDGIELIERVRTSPSAAVRMLPAAALTAYARSEDRTRALRRGFELHLAKPVDPGELVASVSALARRTKEA
jgi:PAS domain S-box-containing protein